MRSIFSKIQYSSSSINNSINSSISSRQGSNDKPSIARLITRKQWHQLEQVLQSFDNPVIAPEAATEVSPEVSPENAPESAPLAAPPVTSPSEPSSNIITPDIIIHLACRFQAPLRIIRLLSARYPGSLEAADASGRFPIHVAAKWGASPEVVQFLLCSSSDTAGIQDHLGKTPMHYVGECYAANFHRCGHVSLLDSMLQVVKLLKTAAPKSVNLEDNEGVNAIEYAIGSDADIKVVKAMQRACRDDWRDMKRKEQGRRHDDLAKDLEKIASDLQTQLHSRRNVLMPPPPPSSPTSPTSPFSSNPKTTTTIKPISLLEGHKQQFNAAPFRITFHKTMKARTRAARTA